MIVLGRRKEKKKCFFGGSGNSKTGGISVQNGLKRNGSSNEILKRWFWIGNGNNGGLRVENGFKKMGKKWILARKSGKW